ncbi:rhomboid family intramembrane serine protease [Neisseria sp. Ec49-e6-T10]|uniref:rhomboid family intramembrane serine protease n=1 Tax=Neisseria sp. Ec49-e6-T10 TaxID=3140744 RepID=UPI003EBB30D8
MATKSKAPKNSLQQRLVILVAVVFMMLTFQIINTFSNNILNGYLGLLPRDAKGLVGIVFAPWLHGDWAHLFANLPILLCLSALAMWHSIRRYVYVSLLIILGTGVLVWCFGRNGIHVGASGWVFGLWAWLLTRAIFEHKIANILISFIVFMFYGGLWWGFLPKEGISFESHLAGVIVGIAIAKYYGKKKVI